MSRILKIGAISILFIFLFIVRKFETNLFYDPFIAYFKNDYLLASFPEIDAWKLFFSMSFRFALNSIISISIIKLLYRSEVESLLLVKIFCVVFIVFVGVYFLEIRSEFSRGYLLSFYLRRLIIHPVLLIILIPSLFVKSKSQN